MGCVGPPRQPEATSSLARRRWDTAVKAPMLRSLSTHAAMALLLLVTTADAVDVCGDMNKSKMVTSFDALLVLRDAVGQPVSLVCPSIEGLVTYSQDLTARSDPRADRRVRRRGARIPVRA